MARLDGSGPANKGPRTGRGLGCCRKINEKDVPQKIGKGMGLRRNAGGGAGKGKRLRSGIMMINK